MPVNFLSALYFPATWIAPATAARLLLVLDKLCSYRPVESPPAIPQPMAATGLLEAWPPAPLGNELDRFRRLLKDMQAHAVEYYQAYLSSLAAGAEEDPETGWRQVARQLKPPGPVREKKEDGLWQARLYLALAEYHAAVQEELTMGIEAVTRRETELLKELQGEAEELADVSLEPTAPTATVVRSEQLLAAWGLLYLADSNTERPWLLATAQEESADLLIEEYERAGGGRPEKLLSLPLPPLATDSEEELAEKLQTLRSAAPELLARIGEVLTEAAFAETGPKTADSGQTAAELGTAWQQAMAHLSGEASTRIPAAELTFYWLPDMSFPRLFRLFCRQEGREAQGSSSPNAVLAVLAGGKR